MGRRILEVSLLGNLSNSNYFSAVFSFCVQRVAILLGYPVKQTQMDQPENVQMLSCPVHYEERNVSQMSSQMLKSKKYEDVTLA